MRVYLLWIFDEMEGDTELRAVFSSRELAQSYADDNVRGWYDIGEMVLNEVE